MARKKVTLEEARTECLLKLQECHVEAAHCDADKALCRFLSSQGHGDIVAVWRKVPKWYA